MAGGRCSPAEVTTRFAEYWNPPTGQGHGGKPQTWATAVAAMAADALA